MRNERPVYLTAESGARTYRYLEDMAVRHGDPTTLMQTVLGRCSLAVMPSLGLDLARTAEDTEGAATRLGEASDPEGPALDPLLLLESCLIMREAGCHLPRLESLAARVAAELSSQPSEVLRSNRVRLIALKLSQLGHNVRAKAPFRFGFRARVDSSSWLGMATAELIEVVDGLLADEASLTKTESRLLALVALGELRNLKTDVACRVMRVLMTQGEIGDEAYEALNFIAVQRQRNGRYGFISPFSEEAKSPAELELGFHLPLTLNAVWLFSLEARQRSSSHAPLVDVL